MEPIEEALIEVPAEYVGAIQMEMGRRKAELVDQFSSPEVLLSLYISYQQEAYVVRATFL